MAKNITRRDLRTGLKGIGHIVKDSYGNYTKGTCSDDNYGTEHSCVQNGSCSDNAFNLKSDCLCGAAGIWDGSACSSGTATGNTWTANTWTKTSYTPPVTYIPDSLNYCTDGVSKTAFECKTAGNCSDDSNKNQVDCLASGTCSDNISTTQAQCEGAGGTWTSSNYTWVTYMWQQQLSPNGHSTYDVMKNWEKSPRMIGDFAIGQPGTQKNLERPGMCICAGGWTYETDNSQGSCDNNPGITMRWRCEEEGHEWTSVPRQVYVCHDPHVLLINSKRGYKLGTNPYQFFDWTNLYDTDDGSNGVCYNQFQHTKIPSITSSAACSNAGYQWETNPMEQYESSMPFNYWSYSQAQKRYVMESSASMVYRRLGVHATENSFWRINGAMYYNLGEVEAQKFGQAYGLVYANGDHTSLTTDYEDLQCANENLAHNGGLCWTAKWMGGGLLDMYETSPAVTAGGWGLSPSFHSSTNGGYYGFESIDFVVADENLKNPNYVNDNINPAKWQLGQSGSQHDLVGSALPPDQQNHGEE